MVRYKIDVLATLKEQGYSSHKLRKDKLIGEATIQRIREGKSVSWDILSKLCTLLQCNVGDLLEYVPEGDNDA